MLETPLALPMTKPGNHRPGVDKPQPKAVWAVACLPQKMTKRMAVFRAEPQ